MIVKTLQDAENILHTRWRYMNAIDRAVIEDRYKVLRAMEAYTHGTAEPPTFAEQTRAAVAQMCATHSV